MTAQELKAAFMNLTSFAISEDLYRMFNNPVHAWAVYKAARKAGVPVPGWVLEYFDECATRMMRAPAAADSAAAVHRAMAFPRRAGSLARDQCKYHEIVARCRDGRRQRPAELDEVIFGEVAERFNLTTERVAAIFYRFTNTASERMSRPKATRRGRRRK
jgi:hypothetical protein